MGRFLPAYDEDGSFCRCYVSSSEEEDYPSGWCDYCRVDFDTEREAKLHKDRVHWYCMQCDRLFRNSNGLQNHIDTAAAHYTARTTRAVSATQARSPPASSRELATRYRTYEIARPHSPDFPCNSCNQAFNTFQQLDHHRLAYHREIKNHSCPFCGSRHASLSAVTHHLENGSCPSGASRHRIDEYILRATQNSSSGVASAIVPRRSAAAEPAVIYRATELSRNYDGRYGCYFCPRLDFPTLSQLNQHLESPKHSKRTPGMYTCPKCQVGMQTLSGLIQHAEMGGCGVRRDVRVQGALEGLTQGMKQLGW